VRHQLPGENHRTTVDKWPIKQVLLNAKTDEADKLTDDKLRVLISFGIHGREYFASELGFKFMDTCATPRARASSRCSRTPPLPWFLS